MEKIATWIINDAEQLASAIHSAFAYSRRHPSELLLDGADRMTLKMEMLTDGSFVYNLCFHNSTPAQRRREKE